MQQRIAALEKVAEAAYEEERTKLDANQYATEQARVAKLAGLREVGYWEPNPPRPSPPLAPPAQSPEAGKTAD